MQQKPWCAARFVSRLMWRQLLPAARQNITTWSRSLRRQWRALDADDDDAAGRERTEALHICARGNWPRVKRRTLRRARGKKEREEAPLRMRQWRRPGTLKRARRWMMHLCHWSGRISRTRTRGQHRGKRARRLELSVVASLTWYSSNAAVTLGTESDRRRRALPLVLPGGAVDLV